MGDREESLGGDQGARLPEAAAGFWDWGRGDIWTEFLEDVSLDSGMKSHPYCFFLKDFNKNGGYF